MTGLLGQIIGIPIIEDKNVREGTYICLDKKGLPIKYKDIGKTPISKVIVHDFETFKIAMKYNEEEQSNVSCCNTPLDDYKRCSECGENC